MWGGMMGSTVVEVHLLKYWSTIDMYLYFTWVFPFYATPQREVIVVLLYIYLLAFASKT